LGFTTGTVLLDRINQKTNDWHQSFHPTNGYVVNDAPIPIETVTGLTHQDDWCILFIPDRTQVS